MARSAQAARTIEDRLRAANAKSPRRFTGTITAEDATTGDLLTNKIQKAARLARGAKKAGQPKE